MELPPTDGTAVLSRPRHEPLHLPGGGLAGGGHPREVHSRAVGRALLHELGAAEGVGQAGQRRGIPPGRDTTGARAAAALLLPPAPGPLDGVPAPGHQRQPGPGAPRGSSQRLAPVSPPHADHVQQRSKAAAAPGSLAPLLADAPPGAGVRFASLCGRACFEPLLLLLLLLLHICWQERCLLLRLHTEHVVRLHSTQQGMEMVLAAHNQLGERAQLLWQQQLLLLLWLLLLLLLLLLAVA